MSLPPVIVDGCRLQDPMNVLTVLPDLPIAPFSHILPSLERHHVAVADLLTLDAADVAKRAQLPAREVQRLVDAILDALHQQYGFAKPLAGDGPGVVQQTPAANVVSSDVGILKWQTISTLDKTLDAALGGGIPTGYVTEVTGESGVGKTQFLLTLLLSSQLPPPHGLDRSALYVSTEGPLQTSRLSQIISTHPYLSSLPSSSSPSLSRILSIQTPDLESQDHILRYQVPVAIKRHNIGLLVIDSITANYRAEFERANPRGGAGASMAKRSAQLMDLGMLLRDLARTEDIAIVVANQVADRFRPEDRYGSGAQSMAPSSNPHPTHYSGDFSQKPPPASEPSAAHRQADGLSRARDPMTLDHQQRWFTGWGDENPFHDLSGLKTPSLGLVWTNQIACRIALVKRPSRGPPQVGGHVTALGAENPRWRRYMKLVFAPWVASTRDGKGEEYVIGSYGIKAVREDEEADSGKENGHSVNATS